MVLKGRAFGRVMAMSKAPSFDLARCGLEGCHWSELTSAGVYDALREHLQEEHGYSDEEWREARSRLMEGSR